MAKGRMAATAGVDELTGLRQKLVGLRNDRLDRLAREVGAGELELLAATAAALIACDERLDELRG
jgi:hypothetical protein